MKKILVYNLPHGYSKGGLSASGVCPCVKANVGQWHPIIVEVEMETKVIGQMQGYEMANRVYDANGLSPTIRTYRGGNLQPKIIQKKRNEETVEAFRIRKLTPKECWRLQGFKDEQFSKAEAVVSASQLYKQAGNSICVPVLEHLFRNLLEVK